MSINLTVVNNVAGNCNCKQDSICSNEVKDKAINKRKRSDNCGKTFEEMIKNAKAVTLVEDFTKDFDKADNVVEEAYKMLEDLLELMSLSIEAQSSGLINKNSNSELEEILGVSLDYYLKEYLEILNIIDMYK